MAEVLVSALGTTSLRGRDGRLMPITRAARRRLLAILVAADGVPTSTDVLIDRFWRGEPPASAKGALHTHVSGLRTQLPKGAIVTDGQGYRLDLDVVDTDVRRLGTYADDVQAARRERDWATIVERATEAWELPDGTPFAELDDDFVEPLRASIEARRSIVDELGIEALIEIGEPESALPLAERLTVAHPLRERGWELLALARSGLGRHGEALRGLHAARAALADAGLEPGAGIREVERVVLAAGAIDEADEHRLPEPFSTFVGRDDELGAVSEQLRLRRLVSIVGVGGVGKSRFSIELARRERDAGSFDRCWFVELADERDPDRVADRVASTVGRAIGSASSPIEAVRDAIRNRPTLVVLDNCEHLTDGAATFAREMLHHCEQLRIVTTTRVPLGVPDEFVVDLPPLRAPTSDRVDVESEAVSLFVARAAAARPGHEFSGADLRLIGTICQRAGGLPLAIELLAARSRDLDLATLAAAAERSFASTTAAPGAVLDRHASMQHVIDWSLSILDAEATTLARRLAVFRGWFDIAAVAAVCELAVDEAQDRIGRLVDASLVRARTATGEGRAVGATFSLLEVVRQALDARLGDDEQNALVERHHDHFAARCAELRLWWMQPPERRAQPTFNPWWDDLPFSIENLRSAADAHPSPGVDLLGVLAHEAAATGHHARAVRSLETLLIAAEVDDRELLAIVRSFLASEIVLTGHPARANVHMAVATEIAETLPVSFAKALVLARASLLTMVLPGVSAAHGVAPALAALDVAEQLGPFARWRVEALAATALARAGRFDEALRHLDSLVEGTRDTTDHATRSLTITAALNVHVLSGSSRATVSPWVDAALVFIAEHPSAAQSDLGSWTMWVLGLAGRTDEAGHILDRIAPIEGYEEAAYRSVRARVDWLGGDVEGAAAAAEATLRNLSDPYWFPNLRTTAAEARSELQDLAAVRHHVEHAESDPLVSGDHEIVPVLRPLVRAEVDAALRSDGRQRAKHERAAREACARMRTAVESLSRDDVPIWLETGEVYLALAEAELTRLGPVERERDAWSGLAGAPRTQRFAEYVEHRLAAVTTGPAPSTPAR